MNIILLGASGSIGTQTLDIIREFKDRFSLVSFSVGKSIDKAKKIIDEFSPKMVCVQNYEDMLELSTRYNNIKFCFGENGLLDVLEYDGLVVNALVGSVGLKPTIRALETKHDVALANKETLVMAGDIVMPLAKKNHCQVLPIDSEHSAIWQCLKNEKNVKRLIITASGGSFRDKTREELKNVTVEDALKHPNWSMGKKITIDSATMMNKGFEVIEAHHLFNIPYENIDTILHKESIVHSMVEFVDSSILAQMATPDMRLPILHALCYKDRLEYDSRLDLIGKNLTFESLSQKRYPCLSYAYQAGIAGGIMPVVLNAANEAAVNLFLNKKISFLQIEEIVKKELDNTINFIPSIDDIIRIDLEIKGKVNKEYGGE